MIYPTIRWRFRPHRLPHPGHLAKAFFYPYMGVVGLFTAVLAICWMLLGVNPVGRCVDFIAESTIVLSPLMLKLGVIWLIYAAAYVLSLFQYELALVIPLAGTAAAVPIFHAKAACFRLAASLGRWVPRPIPTKTSACSSQYRHYASWTNPAACGWKVGLHPQRE